MVDLVGNTIRELRAFSHNMDTMKIETRLYLEEKDKEFIAMQEKIKVLCNTLEEMDATILRASSKTRNNSKRPGSGGEDRLKPDFEIKKIKPADRTSESESSLKFKIVDDFTQVYTDGSCLNNGKEDARAGVGIWWGQDHAMNLSQRVVGKRQTSNGAEIQAASLAIRQAMGAEISRLEVNTDSQYSINCAQSMQKWKKNGWRTTTGQDVKNKGDLVQLDKLLSSGTITVKWNHVKGHTDIKGNIEAHRLAVKGASLLPPL